jgi:D-glycero-D-manno-heptose 1,7-bisphosphate phosphatase
LPCVPDGETVTQPGACRAAVILDRDGVINVKAPLGEYIRAPAALVLACGAAAAIRRLNQAQIPVFVVTNQRWVASTHQGDMQLAAVHRKLAELLSEVGAYLDGIFTCPHPITCRRCRKPALGLVRDIHRLHGQLILSDCALVGDSESDIHLGIAFAMRTVRIGPPGTVTGATVLADDLATALPALLSWMADIPQRPKGRAG